MRGGGGLKDWYHHLIRAMISLVKQTKSSVVEKLRICQLLENYLTSRARMERYDFRNGPGKLCRS